MYRIQKQGKEWTIRNNISGNIRSLAELEVADLLEEFPCLKSSTNVSYFRNQIQSLDPLPQ